LPLKRFSFDHHLRMRHFSYITLAVI
jgi:hypothetical protein